MSFEKLRVYQAAVLLDKMILALVKGLPAKHWKDVDQLRRATASIIANIAEAYGSLHVGQKTYYLGIARGSADESRAHMRRLVNDGGLSEEEIKQPHILARTIAKMLTSLIDKLKEEGE